MNITWQAAVNKQLCGVEILRFSADGDCSSSCQINNNMKLQQRLNVTVNKVREKQDRETLQTLSSISLNLLLSESWFSDLLNVWESGFIIISDCSCVDLRSTLEYQLSSNVQTDWNTFKNQLWSTPTVRQSGYQSRLWCEKTNLPFMSSSSPVELLNAREERQKHHHSVSSPSNCLLCCLRAAQRVVGAFSCCWWSHRCHGNKPAVNWSEFIYQTACSVCSDQQRQTERDSSSVLSELSQKFEENKW